MRSVHGLAIAAFVVVAVLTKPLQAETVACGAAIGATQAASGTWGDGTTCTITMPNNVTINAAATITIAANTTISVTGDFTLTVNGVLQTAVGASGVVFEAATAPTGTLPPAYPAAPPAAAPTVPTLPANGNWGGINVTGASSRIAIDSVTLRHSRKALTIASTNAAASSVTNSIFENNRHIVATGQAFGSALVIANGTPTVRSNIFRNNAVGVSGEGNNDRFDGVIYISGTSTPQFELNDINNNTAWGYQGCAAGVAVNSTGTTLIRGGQIHQNVAYGKATGTNGTIFAAGLCFFASGTAAGTPHRAIGIRVTSNYVSAGVSNAAGAGVTLAANVLHVDTHYNIILNNIARGAYAEGGGIDYWSSNSGIIYNNAVIGNVVYQDGGGANARGSAMLVNNAGASPLQVFNNTIHGNYSPAPTCNTASVRSDAAVGAAVYLQAGTIDVRNNSFSGNSNSAIIAATAGTFVVETNNFFGEPCRYYYDNNAPAGVGDEANGTNPEAGDFKGNPLYTGVATPTWPGLGSVDLAWTKYKLSNNSPLIDVGDNTNTAIVTADIDVLSRQLANGTYQRDIGFDEIQSDIQVTVSDSAATEIPGTAATYTVQLASRDRSTAFAEPWFLGFADDVQNLNAQALTGTLEMTAQASTMYRFDSWSCVATGTGMSVTPASGTGAPPLLALAIRESNGVSFPGDNYITCTVNVTVRSSAAVSAVNPSANIRLNAVARQLTPVGVPDVSPTNQNVNDTDTLTPQADLRLTLTDGVTVVNQSGAAPSYTAVISNFGPSDVEATVLANVFTPASTGLTRGAFTCAVTSVSTGVNAIATACENANGTGDIGTENASLGAGGVVAYTHALVGPVAGAATCSQSMSYQLTLTPPTTPPGASVAVTDATPADATQTDTNAINCAPVAVLESYVLTEDGSISRSAALGILSNDTDPDADILTAVLDSNVTNGVLALNANGSFTYTPNPNYAGSDSFTYRASDSFVTSNLVTVEFTVNAADDPPVLSWNGAAWPLPMPVATTDEDTNITLSGGTSQLIGVVDVDTASVTVVFAATTGTLSLSGTNGLSFGNGDGTNDPTMTFSGAPLDVSIALAGAVYRPLLNDSGAETISISVSDLTTTVAQTILVTINSVNDTPTISAPVSASIDEDTALPIAASFDDADDAGGVEQLSVSVSNGRVTFVSIVGLTLVGGSNGSASMTWQGTKVALNAALSGLSYQGDSNYFGPDTLVITVNDLGNSGGAATEGTRNVGITVNSVNDDPVAAADSYSVVRDQVLTVAAPGVLSNDSDVESTPTAVLVSDVTNGALTLNADGSFTYVPTLGYEGPDSFVYRANDGSANSADVTVSLDVTPDNVAPETSIVAGPDSLLLLSALSNQTAGSFDLSSNEAVVTYECMVDGTPYSACADPFTFTGLSDGPHTLAARARDGSNNVDGSPAFFSWVIDTVAPNAPTVLSPAMGDTTAQSSPVVSGLAAPNSTVMIYADGAAFGPVLTDAGGYWSLPAPGVAPFPLADGPHAVYAEATDAAGNTGPVSPTTTFSVDSNILDTIVASGPDTVSNDATPGFAFTSLNPTGLTTFECSVDEAVYAPCTDNFTSGTLLDGAHTLLVRALNGAVRDASPASFVWTQDSAAPADPVVISPSEGATVGSTSVAISGTAEPFTRVSIVIAGTPAQTLGPIVVDSFGAWTALATGLVSGNTYVASVTAEDAAGNISPTATRTFSVETLLIDTTVASGPPAQSRFASATFDFTSNRPNATFECALDGAPDFVACTDPFTIGGLSDGPHTLRVRAVDGGDTDLTPATYSWNIDATAPTLTVTTPLDNALVGTSALVVSGTTEPNATVRVTIDGAFAGTALADGAGTYTFTSVALSEGPHEVTAQAFDSVSNSSPLITQDVTIDSVAPDTSIDSSTGTFPSPINTRTATFTFLSVDGSATFECSVDGAVFVTCTSVFTVSALSDGPHSFAVRAVDATGNRDASPAQLTWVVDGTAGNAPTLTDVAHLAVIATRDPTMRGTAEPGATVTVFVDGSPAGDTVADSGGAWSFASPGSGAYPLADGAHEVYATATDAAGNLSAASPTHTFTVDLGALDTFLLSGPPAFANVNTATITFTGVNGSVATTFDCSLDVQVFAPCSGPGSEHTVVGLSEGAHTLRVRAHDGSRVDASPAAVSWVVDTIAPVAPVITQPANNDTVGTLTPTLQGTAEPGSRVTVTITAPTLVLGPVTVSAQGVWSVTSSALVNLATYTAVASSTDAAGNSSSSSDTTFTVDTSAADTQILSGPNALSTVASASFTFASNVAPASFECRVDAGGFAPCASPMAYSGLSEGAHTFYVRTTGVNGTDPSPASYTWTVDTLAPADPTITQPTAAQAFATTTPLFTGIAEPNATVLIYVDGTYLGATVAEADGAYVFANTTPLAEGAHTMEAQARDAAGNTSGRVLRAFSIDSASPDTLLNGGLVSVAQLDALVNQASGAFRFASSDLTATFECSVDGASYAACTAPFAVTSLSNGVHTFAVRAVDAALNVDTTPEVWTFTVDTLPPNPPVIARPANTETIGTTTPHITGTAEANSTVSVFIDSALAGTAVASATGTFDYLVTTPLSEGAHVVTASSTDAAGNDSPVSAESAFTVDTTTLDTFITSAPNVLSNSADANFIYSSNRGGVTFECALDTTTFVACAVSAFSNLGEGSHTFSVRAVDGNDVDNTPASFTWTIDTQDPAAPVIQSPADNDIVGTLTPIISGTAEASTQLTVTITGTSGPFTLGPITVGPTGQWSAPTTIALQQGGNYSATAVTVDAAGNASPVSLATDFAVDTTTLDTFIIRTPLVLSRSSEAVFEFNSNDPNATFECAVDGGLFLPCSVPFTLSSVSNGQHTFRVQAVNASLALTDATPASFTWSVDVVIPAVVSILDPQAVVGTTRPAVTGQATPGALVVVSIDGLFVGSAIADAGGLYRVVPTQALVEGEHTVTAFERDSFGNDGPVATKEFTVDTTVADTTLLTTPPSLSNSGNAAFTFRSDDPGSTFECSLDGALAVPCTSGVSYAALGDGEHTFTVTSIDALGRRDETPASFKWTIDTMAPAAPVITAPQTDSAFEGGPLTIRGTAGPGEVIELTVDGAVVGTTTADANGDWSFTRPDLAAGAHTISVVAIDPAGNRSPSSTVSLVAAQDIVPPEPGVGFDATNWRVRGGPNCASSTSQSSWLFGLMALLWWRRRQA